MARSSDEFQQLLLSICQEVTEDKLDKMKFLCGNRLPARTLAEIKRAEDLFSTLQHNGFLNERNTKYLEDLLEQVGLVRLVEELHAFKESDDSRPTSDDSCFRANLPCKVKHFQGRDNIVDEMVSVISQQSTRITIVIAPPGFGKSAVATHAGHVIYKQRYASVLYVSLRQRKALADVCLDIVRCCQKGSPLNAGDDDPVLQAQNVLTSLESRAVLILDNAEDIQHSSSGPMFVNFIQYLGNHAEKVQLILTTRQDVQISRLDVYKIQLPALEPSFASSLLSQLAHAAQPATGVALELGKLCGGVPLFLRLTASLLNNGFDPKVLARMLRSSGPIKVLQMPNPELEGFYETLLLFFKKIKKRFLTSLVRVSVFPTSFTAADACFLFEDRETCECSLSSLVGCGLLQHTIGRSYEVHPLVQSFCRTERGRLGLDEEGRKADEAFIQHNLQQLQQIHREFLSENGSQTAFKSFRQKQGNIMWALKKSLSFDLPSNKMKRKAVDVCTEAVNFLGKALRPDEFNELYEQCLVVSSDKIRQSDCLISLGFRHLLDVDHRTHSAEASECFQNARKLRVSMSPSQRLLECEEHAHCTSKLGVCHVLAGDMRGRELVIDALKIRKKRGDVLMEAAGYCDLALTFHIESHHRKAIDLWQKHTLKQYKKHLGNHPWVATALNYIADAYQALGDLDNTIKYKKQALAMREKLLGKGHLDTTRSRVQLAKIYKAQGRLDDALEGLGNTLELQEKNLGVHEDTVNTMSEMAELMRQMKRLEDAECMAQREEKCRDELKSRREFQRQRSRPKNGRDIKSIVKCFLWVVLGLLMVCFLCVAYCYFDLFSPGESFSERITKEGL